MSRFNVGLCVIMILVMLLPGPGAFIVSSFFTSAGVYVQNFVGMSLTRADPEWLNLWSVFFRGWFISYASLMGILVAVISRGRTIRQLVVGVSLIAPVALNPWFTVLGRSRIFYELQDRGSVSGPLGDAGQPAALLAIVQQAPLGFFMIPASLVLVAVFIATTGDSMAYTMATTVSDGDSPPTAVRVFWRALMGAVAAIMIQIGEGGITALQSFIVVAAVPGVSLILVSLLWVAPKVAGEMAREQGVVGDQLPADGDAAADQAESISTPGTPVASEPSGSTR